MSTSCVVCKGGSQCNKCIIKDLKKRIEILNYELRYLRKDSNPLLKNKDYTTHFELDNKFLALRYYGSLTEYQFLTITFDPNKFGLFNQPKDEQNYIFRVLYKCLHYDDGEYRSPITQLTGCFEYQKNGTTHAHIIIRTAYTPKQIEDFLRPQFTDDVKNKCAIKSYLLQKEKCEDYLIKESTEYFRYDKTNGLDDGLDMVELDEPIDKDNLTISQEQLVLIMEAYKREQEIAYKKFAIKMSQRYSNVKSLDKSSVNNINFS